MARLANDALLRAGLAEAVIVGDARRGVELVDELPMVVRVRATRPPWRERSDAPRPPRASRSSILTP